MKMMEKEEMAEEMSKMCDMMSEMHDKMMSMMEMMGGKKSDEMGSHKLKEKMSKLVESISKGGYK